jgi:uncharacterized protein (DUF2141 family)
MPACSLKNCPHIALNSNNRPSAMIIRIFLTALLMGLFTPAVKAELPSIKLVVSGADPATGTIEATLFNSAQDFLLEAHLQESGDVSEDGSFEAEFIGLEEGEYAIVVVHDANENGVYDAGLLGFGGESVGYSNNASSWFGRPGFDDASFTVDQAGQIVSINLD